LGLSISYLALGPADAKGTLHLPENLPDWAGVGFLLAGLLALSRASHPLARVNRLAWASLLAMLWLLFALVRPLTPAYDVAPMARELARHQALGHPVANEGKYHAQFQFVGRLTTPLTELTGKALTDWLTSHPDGVAVIYLGANEDATPYQPLFSHRFRGVVSILIGPRGAAAVLGRKPVSKDEGED
jgi:hypothetical protein